MGMQTKIQLAIAAALTTALDIGTAEYSPNFNQVFNLGDGTGADQANMIWSDTRTLTASATENLDLAGGLTNAFGATVTFSKLKAILVVASTGNTNSVQVTRPASNGVPLFMAAGDGVALTPGAAFAAVFPDANGVAVTGATGDLLTLTNSAGSTSVTYTIILIGTV
jgi:hypothetical protein